MLDFVARPASTAARLLLLASLALPAGCAAPPEPVAVARLVPDRTRVPLGASFGATIQFDVSPAFEPLNEDYRVLLHVFDDSGDFLWSDEHDPPVPTSTWRRGQSFQYTRRVTVPPYPYVGPAVVALSLRSPDSERRLPLAGNEQEEFVYRVATLTLEPQSESSFVVYDEGWHQLEFDAFSRSVWRWTTGRAVLSFRNPHGTATLRLDVQGNPTSPDRPQRLSLAIGDRTLAEVVLDTNDLRHLEFALTADELGDSDVVQLELLVDGTYVPAERHAGAGDTRELGVRVFYAYVEPLP